MNGVAAIRATPNLIFTVGAFLYFYRGAADLLAGVAGFFISILANECRRSFSFLFAGAAEQPAPVLLVGTTPLLLPIASSRLFSYALCGCWGAAPTG